MLPNGGSSVGGGRAGFLRKTTRTHHGSIGPAPVVGDLVRGFLISDSCGLAGGQPSGGGEQQRIGRFRISGAAFAPDSMAARRISSFTQECVRRSGAPSSNSVPE